MTDAIRVETESQIRTIRFNRPDKKNAITAFMYDAMADAVESAQNDPDIRCVLFLGTEGCFTAGNDIADFLAVSQGGDGLGPEVLRFLRAIATSDIPLIAGVDGLAIGIGTTMLFHCDMVLATRRSLFKTPFLDLGLVPEAASTLLFPRLMGHHRAFEMLCLGEPLDADRATQAGFVNRITPETDLESEARSMAERIASRPPGALRLSRRMLKNEQGSVLQRIDEEAEHFKTCLVSDEAKEAFLAFTEKRKPKF